MRTHNEIAEDIAKFLTDARPQIDGKKLQWYFAGSLSTLLLAQAERIVEVELTKDGEVVKGYGEIVVDDKKRAGLQLFNRQIRWRYRYY